MSQYVEAPTRSFDAGAALGPHLRVKLTASKLQLAGATDLDVGTMHQRTLAADDPGTVRLRTAQGTTKMVASEAITAFATVYAAASGKIAASGLIPIGVAMEAAAANNDVIEVLRMPLSVFDYTQTVTPTAAEGAGNSIVAGVTQVALAANVTDANDFFVLPPIADVPIGFTIRIAVNGGANCEMRTPASSNTKINDVDADGSQEYLCTSTHLIVVTKHTTTSWVAVSYTKLGAVVTAVVPD